MPSLQAQPAPCDSVLRRMRGFWSRGWSVISIFSGMPTALVSLLTALMLGFLHALEVDHMIAVTTFVAGRPRLATAARFGFRWGIGHSLAVLLFGGLLLVTGLRWPARYDRVGEAIVGTMLVGLGLWAIRSSRKLHFHPAPAHGDHAHLHVHADGPRSHDHPHEGSQHAGERTHRHHSHESHGITLVGLMHGLAGTSAVVALVPVTLIQRLDVGFGYLVIFGVGVTAGMTVYSMVAALAMRQAIQRSIDLGRRLAGGVGVMGMIVGALWIWRAVTG
jgi:ABC-type nickel/cobalt efflux system permease component RcnA